MKIVTKNAKDDDASIIEIMADDGKVLFSIGETEDGGIFIRSVHLCKHKGFVLDTPISIQPYSSFGLLINRQIFR